MGYIYLTNGLNAYSYEVSFESMKLSIMEKLYYVLIGVRIIHPPVR